MSKKGFTLIEILIVIAIIAILAAGVILALNPGRQFAKTNDAKRSAHLNQIMSAIFQNITENQGKFKCNGTDFSIPTSSTIISSSTAANIAPCLVPTYIKEMPVDPSTGIWINTSSYNTQYSIFRDATTGRITLSATSEVNPTSTIQITQ